MWDKCYNELLFDKDSFVEVNDFIESRINDFNLNERRVLGEKHIYGGVIYPEKTRKCIVEAL